MTRRVAVTPLFTRRMQEILEEYAEMGAVRFVERLQRSYHDMVENISAFEEIAPARKRTIKGRKVTVREYVLDAGARSFLVLYWIPPDPVEPILLLNIRIGGQSRFQWLDTPYKPQ